MAFFLKLLKGVQFNRFSPFLFLWNAAWEVCAFVVDNTGHFPWAIQNILVFQRNAQVWNRYANNFFSIKKNLQRFMLNSSSCCEINVCGIINRKKIVSYNLWRKFVSGKNFLWKIVLSMEIFNSPTVTPQEPTEDAISNKQGDTGYRLLELLAWNTEREMVGKKIALLTVSQLL